MRAHRVEGREALAHYNNQELIFLEKKCFYPIEIFNFHTVAINNIRVLIT